MEDLPHSKPFKNLVSLRSTKLSRQETPNSVGGGRIMYDNVVVDDGDDDDDVAGNDVEDNDVEEEGRSQDLGKVPEPRT